MSSSNGGNLYEYPNGVLRNKRGLLNSEDLARAEATLTALRIAELSEHSLPARFDLDYLKALHRHIFQDIY